MTNDTNTPIPPNYEAGIADDWLAEIHQKDANQAREALIHPIAERWVRQFMDEAIELDDTFAPNAKRFRECSAGCMAELSEIVPLFIKDPETGAVTRTICVDDVIGLMRIAMLFGWWFNDNQSEIELPDDQDLVDQAPANDL